MLGRVFDPWRHASTWWTLTHLVSDEGKGDLRDVGGLARSTAGVLLRELVGLAATGADDEDLHRPEGSPTRRIDLRARR